MTEIRVFEHRTLLRHPREVVFRWLENPGALDNGDYVYLPGIRKALLEAADEMIAVAVKPDGGLVEFRVRLGAMTDAERQILADGCLINYYKNH